MLRFLKEKLDDWAIRLAAKSLPTGKANSGAVKQAAKLLENPGFLEPLEKTAVLTRGEGGAFRFESNITTASPQNNVVQGKLFRVRQDWDSRPLVILVHGWNAELHYLYILPRIARALNERGLNAALIELPYHLHRRPGGDAPGAHDFISDDLPTMLISTRQAICDLHALARWAREEGCGAVAVWGFSLGAWLAGLYIAKSTLPSHAVLTTPIIDMARGIRELSFCHPVRAALADSELDLRRLNLTEQIPLIPPENIYVGRCVYDRFVPPESYEQLRSAWKLPDCACSRQGHISVLISSREMRRTMDWLAERLLAATPAQARTAAPMARD